MWGEIIYHEIISYIGKMIEIQAIRLTEVERGKLILLLENSQKIIIEGKALDASGHKNRVIEIVEMAKEKGFTVKPTSVAHYASCPDEGPDREYVLIRH